MPTVTILHRFSITLIACSINMLSASEAFPSDKKWKVWTVDPQPISGNTSSCAFLPNGDVIIGFENNTRNQTRAARFDGHNWRIESVVATDAKGVSMAVDTSGKVYLSSIDLRSRSLRISTFEKGEWTSKLIDSNNRYMGPTSVALTKNNDPTVFAYTLGINALRVFVEQGGVWTPQVVTEPGGYEVSGAINVSGLIACASMNGNVPMLSLSEGNKWSHHQLDGVGRLKGPNALDFNGESLPALVVSGHGSEGLKLATFSDGKLSTEFIEKGIPASSASIDHSEDGRPVVAYIDRSDLVRGLLKVATRVDGRWNIETVDRWAGGGWQTDVAWGPDGKIGVSYYDQENRTLKFALKTNQTKNRTDGSNQDIRPR